MSKTFLRNLSVKEGGDGPLKDGFCKKASDTFPKEGNTENMSWDAEFLSEISCFRATKLMKIVCVRWGFKSLPIKCVSSSQFCLKVVGVENLPTSARMSFVGDCDCMKPGNADSLHDKMISQVARELVNRSIG